MINQKARNKRAVRMDAINNNANAPIKEQLKEGR